MKGKLKFILPLVALILLGGAYKTVLAKPGKPAPKPKVEGQIYVLPKEFLVNLASDRYAKLTVALVLPEKEAVVAKGEGAAPPEGWGTLPQEAVIRGIVTDTLTGIKAEKLISPEGRDKVKEKLLTKIHKYSDVKAEEVLLTDVAVQ
jgi:flagellar FliL protein